MLILKSTKITLLIFIMALLTSGFVFIPSTHGSAAVMEGNGDSINIEINGMLFAVDNGGIPPTTDDAIAEFVDDVYIAHNFLAGKYFADSAKIEYVNGEIIEYQEVETIVLQAIDPYDPATKYTDGEYIYTSDDIHFRIFNRGVVFVTCVDKDNQLSWGRKFIIMKNKR